MPLLVHQGHAIYFGPMKTKHIVVLLGAVGVLIFLGIFVLLMKQEVRAQKQEDAAKVIETKANAKQAEAEADEALRVEWSAMDMATMILGSGNKTAGDEWQKRIADEKNIAQGAGSSLAAKQAIESHRRDEKYAPPSQKELDDMKAKRKSAAH